MSHTSSELIWIHGLVADLHVPVPRPIDFFCDNAAAKYIADILSQTMRIPVLSNIIHVRSGVQLANILTKSFNF